MEDIMIEEDGVVLGKFIKSGMIYNSLKNRLVLKVTYKTGDTILSKQYEVTDTLFKLNDSLELSVRI